MITEADTKDTVGEIAHILTGIVGATCCHKTGGYGGPYGEYCYCREAAKEILKNLGGGHMTENQAESTKMTDHATSEKAARIFVEFQSLCREHGIKAPKAVVFESPKDARGLLYILAAPHVSEYVKTDVKKQVENSAGAFCGVEIMWEAPK